jgi:hypothetical protein
MTRARRAELMNVSEETLEKGFFKVTNDGGGTCLWKACNQAMQDLRRSQGLPPDHEDVEGDLRELEEAVRKDQLKSRKELYTDKNQVEKRLEFILDSKISLEEKRTSDVENFGNEVDAAVYGKVKKVNVVVFKKKIGEKGYEVINAVKPKVGPYDDTIYMVHDNCHYEALFPKGDRTLLPTWHFL